MAKFSNEFILPHKLSQIQHEVMIGGLLGDSSLGLSKTSKFPRLSITRQIRDKEYLLWQYNLFSDLCTTNSFKEFDRYDERYDKTRRYCSFRTRAVPAFLEYYNKWYVNKIKTVPENIELTPLTLAVWFADDGMIKIHGKNSFTIKFSTESFKEKGALILSNKLESMFGYRFPIYQKKKDKDQFIIKISTGPALKIIQYIDPVFNFGMERKSDKWKNIDLNNIDFSKYYQIDSDKTKKSKLFITNSILNLVEFSKKDLIEISKSFLGEIKIYFIERLLTKSVKLNHINRIGAGKYLLTPSGQQYFNYIKNF